MLLPVTILSIFFLCYFFLLLIYFTGLLVLKGPIREEPDAFQELTVVIPFRNELTHLPGILSDLLAQRYPAHLFSVIMVNDHSSDGSEKLVESLIEGREGFMCLDLPGSITGKKEAIAHALSRVTTAWVLQTDADCSLGPGFISSHMHFLAEHPADLVAGMVTSKERQGGFLEAFERLDLLGLNGTAAGSFALGKPLMCSGANLLYSKALYQETRIFDPLEKAGSGDDMFLMIGARKLKKRLAFNPARDCLVYTSPSINTAALLRQRIRWGAKSIYYRMADIQMVAFLVGTVNILMLLAPVLMLLKPELCRWLLPGIGSKLLADFLILAASSFKSGQTRTLWWYFPVSLVYPLFMAIVIPGLFINRSRWKDRPV